MVTRRRHVDNQSDDKGGQGPERYPQPPCGSAKQPDLHRPDLLGYAGSPQELRSSKCLSFRLLHSRPQINTIRARLLKIEDAPRHGQRPPATSHKTSKEDGKYWQFDVHDDLNTRTDHIEIMHSTKLIVY